MNRAGIINRRRVFHYLRAVYEFPLTIVEAPMGFGKTTAVRSFFASEKIEPLWITFRESGNASMLFWHAFTGEISKWDEKAATALKSIGIPNDLPHVDKALSILNSITIPDKLIIVIDDYQLSQDIQLNKFIFQLAQEEFAGLHMMLITRDTSNLDFVELLSKGLCTVISQQKLKFTEDEIAEYCRMTVNQISNQDIEEISKYTDGWISFIYLILLGLEQGIPVGMNKTIDELIEKVLFCSYDKAIQEFLLQLSLVEDFTDTQAEYVTGNNEAINLLKKLNRENAFIFYDEINKTYKIHNVILDFLRIKQRFSDEKLRELYGKIGNWYLNSKNFDIAYGYLYRSGQTERVLSLLNEPQNMGSKLPAFKGKDEMFDSVPREYLFQYPFAYLRHIFLSLINGKKNSILSWAERLDELQKYYEETNCIDEEYRNRVVAEILVVRIFTLFNDADRILDACKKICQRLKGSMSYIATPNNVYTFGSPHYLYLYFREKGSFNNLKDTLSQGVGYAAFSNGCGEGSDSLTLAEYALETGDWKNIELNCAKAIQKAKLKKQISIILCAKFSLIRFRIFQGQTAQAFEVLEQLERDIENTDFAAYYTTVDMCKGYIYACLNQPEKIPFWLQTGDMDSAYFYYQGIGFNYLTYGKVLIALERYKELNIMEENFHDCFSLYSNRLGIIHNYIFQAVASYHLYNIDVGIAVLEKGLFSAEQDNIIMPFVETAVSIIKMVEIIAEKYPNNDYIQRVLIACRQYERTIQSIRYETASLSNREIDVLTLAANGLSRKEVAVSLCISEETVKTHFKNIYEKLGANGKVEAIKMAQTRGYIMPHIINGNYNKPSGRMVIKA